MKHRKSQQKKAPKKIVLANKPMNERIVFPGRIPRSITLHTLKR